MCSLPTPGHCKTPTAPLPQALHSSGQERSGRQVRQGAGQTDSSPHLPGLGHGVRSSGGLEEPQVWARGPQAFLWVLSPIPRRTWARPALATIINPKMASGLQRSHFSDLVGSVRGLCAQPSDLPGLERPLAQSLPPPQPQGAVCCQVHTCHSLCPAPDLPNRDCASPCGTAQASLWGVRAPPCPTLPALTHLSLLGPPGSTFGRRWESNKAKAP